MGVLFVVEGSWCVGQAHPPQHVSNSSRYPSSLSSQFFRIRFAPPLVIEEDDLRRVIRTIGQCLEDIDVVSLCLDTLLCGAEGPVSVQIDAIPGDTDEEKQHVDEIAC